MKPIVVLFISLLLVSCGSGGDWHCVEDGKTMYSRNTSGELGGAGKGCSCADMRSFEQRTFGVVDEDALKRDFGC